MYRLPFLVRVLRHFEFPHKHGIMDRLFGKSLAKGQICWVETANGLPWKLDLENCTNRWIVYGYYEGPGIHRWARRHVPRNGVIVDSGANIGQLALYMASWIPKGKLLAFEPGQEQADWLAECLAMNPGLPIELIRKGLSSESRHAYLTSAGNPHTHGGQNSVSETEGTPIQLTRLDDEIEKRGYTDVDFWKLDVEGHEVAALAGAGRLLSEHRIKAMYIELHKENGERIRDYLAALGYSCLVVDQVGRTSELTVLPEHCNGLFLPIGR